MPSREIRRIKARKGEKPENPVEEKRTQHPLLYVFTVVILVIIVVTFIGLPATKGGQGGGARIVFGYYDGKPIEFAPGNYFARQVEAIGENARQNPQTKDMNQDVLFYQVWRSAFDQTVTHLALMRQAETAGVQVSEDKVDKALIESGPYMVDGRFSEERYRNTPNSERYTIRRQTREQAVQDQVLRDMFNGQLQSDRESEFFAAMGENERRFDFVTYPFADYPQDQVKAFGEENKDKFRKIKLSRIQVQGENEAREIRKKLDDRTSSFEELAKAHSRDSYAEKGGDMGWRYYYDLAQDFEGTEAVDQVMRLNEGEISGVLHSKFGWVIYRADQPMVALDTQSPDSLQVVRDYIMRYERGRVEDWFLAQARKFSAEAREKGFSGAASAAGLSLHTTKYFPVNYQGLFQLSPVEAEGEGTSIASAAYSEEFFRKAFALKQGEVSEPVSLDDQVLVLQFRDAKTVTGDERDFLKQYFRYVEGQTLQADLQQKLIDPALLKDDFNTVFYRDVYRRG